MRTPIDKPVCRLDVPGSKRSVLAARDPWGYFGRASRALASRRLRERTASR